MTVGPPFRGSSDEDQLFDEEDDEEEQREEAELEHARSLLADDLRELEQRLEETTELLKDAEGRAREAEDRLIDQMWGEPVSSRFLVANDVKRDQIVGRLESVLAEIEELEDGTATAEAAKTFVVPFLALSIGALNLNSGSIERLAWARSQVLLTWEHLNKAQKFFIDRDAIVNNLIASAIWALGIAVNEMR